MSTVDDGDGGANLFKITNGGFGVGTRKGFAMAKDDAKAVELPNRTIVIETDGNRANVPKNTMGLFEAKAILESVLRWVCDRIDQRSRAAPPAVEQGPEESAEPEETTL